MKTKLFVSILALSVSYSAMASDQAKNYNGWTLGVDGGWVGSSLKYTKNNGALLNNNGSSSKDLKHFNQASFGIHTDWHKTLANHMYFGFGLGAGFHAGNPSKNFENVKIDNNKNYNSSIKQQRNFYAEVAGRLGWNFNKAVLYALGVLKTTHMEHKIEFTGNNNNKSSQYNYSEKKFINAVGFGGGFDFKINKDWSFGAEYRYMFEESLDVNDPNSNGLINASLSKLRSHNVLGRVSYHF